MTDLLPITPFTRPCRGQARVPGSKSITNRALLLAALSQCRIRLEGALFSDDVQVMIKALRTLGFSLEDDAENSVIEIQGENGRIPFREADLFVGNAGTVARFLTAALCLQWGGKYRLDGTEAMRERPMRGLLDLLVSLGVRVKYEKTEGHFPFILETSGLKGGEWVVDATASSQILSAMLMVAPLADGDVTVILDGETVSKPFVLMTMKICNQFLDGMSLFRHDRKRYETVDIQAYSRETTTYFVEPDSTAASYFLALPIATGGSCEVAGVKLDGLQGDAAFSQVLQKMGLPVQFSQQGVHVTKGDTPSGGTFDFNAISDTFLTLAALAPLLKEPTKITGIAHTRKQETDRVSAMANELRKMGQIVEESEDSITVLPDRNKLLETAAKGVEIDTYEDHRVAMSFGVLGSADPLGDGRSWLAIRNPDCCGKTFPGFFDELERLRLLSLAPS